MWSISKRLKRIIYRRASENYGILFLNTGSYAAGNFQSAISPTIFIGDHPNFMTNLVSMVNLNAC